MPLSPGLAGPDPASANALQGGAAVGAPPAFNLVKQVRDGYERAQAQHSKLQESFQRLEVVRTELDSMAKLGDQISPEDVIKSAGAMVGAGFTPAALAQLLSSMPAQGGEALQAWVQQQDGQVRQMEQSIKGPMVQSALHLGGAAMAQLHVNHAHEKNEGAKRLQVQGPVSSPSNALAAAPQPETQEA